MNVEWYGIFSATDEETLPVVIPRYKLPPRVCPREFGTGARRRAIVSSTFPGAWFMPHVPADGLANFFMHQGHRMVGRRRARDSTGPAARLLLVADGTRNAFHRRPRQFLCEPFVYVAENVKHPESRWRVDNPRG